LKGLAAQREAENERKRLEKEQAELEKKQQELAAQNARMALQQSATTGTRRPTTRQRSGASKAKELHKKLDEVPSAEPICIASDDGSGDEKDTTDYPPTISAEKSAARMKLLLQSREKESYTFTPGQLVVYCESELTEKQRAGIVVEFLSETRVRVKFQLVGSGVYEFSGRTRTVHPVFCYEAQYNYLSTGRRFSFAGPPPRITGKLPFTVACRCDDHNLTTDTVVTVAAMDTIKIPHQDGFVRGLVLGFMMNHNWNHDFRILVLHYMEGEDLLTVLEQSAECDRRLGHTTMPEFYGIMNPDPPKATGPGVIIHCDALISDEASPVALAVRKAMAIVENHLTMNKSWRPKFLKRTIEEFWARMKPRTAQTSSSSSSKAVVAVTATSGGGRQPKDNTKVRQSVFQHFNSCLDFSLALQF